MRSDDLVFELGTNFIEYAAAVNTDRAIPDARDGLKPVAKRILYGAYSTGRSSNKPHVKCARIVGDVMGSFHPHGDSSIYGALVRLAQDWVMRYPLIDFHGNMGNIGGDGAAAYRYTEARLGKLSEDGMLFGLKKENVPFKDNYDETTVEPAVLPAIFPNLLCNPNTGIGVAMACNWLPHNLTEVANAIYQYMDGEEPTLPGPDFPTGGLIINKNDLPNIIKSGHGTVKLRARYNIEKQNIIFYEIPYGTTTEGILTEIGELCEKKEIEGISDIRDESNKKGIRIVIQCSPGIGPEGIAQKLYAKTDLQTSISYNQVALVDKVPTELGLKDCIRIYLEHNKECLKKETEYDYKKAMERKEVVEGLLKALEDIDNVIALIRASKSSADAKDQLIAKYKFTERQATAIVNMRLGSLANLEKVELNNEFAELKKSIEQYVLILQDEISQNLIIRDRLQNLVKKYGDARRTEMTHIEPPSKEEKEIVNVEPEKCVVIMSESGLIKRIPSTAFKVQKRNGIGVKTKDGITKAIIKTNTIDSLMVFTNKGQMYRILVDNIPAGTNVSKGTPIKALVEMMPGEEPTLIYSIYYDTDAQYVMFVTKNGIVKKTALTEYVGTKKKSGIVAINLVDGDELASVSLVKDEQLIMLTKNGMTIRFKTTDVSPTGRATRGVKGINLLAGDEVVAALPIRDVTDDIAIFAQNGNGKRVKLNEFTVQTRGGKGLIGYKVSPSTGNVVGGQLVNDDDNLLVCGSTNSICIKAKDINTMGRSGLGVQVIKSTITSVSKI